MTRHPSPSMPAALPGLVWAILLTVLAAAASANPPSDNPLVARLYQPDPWRPLIVPHRGHWREAPENSLAAIDAAIRAGAMVIEVDLRETRDGSFVLMHDSTLDRTTTGTGPVAARSLAELAELRLRNGYGLATEQRIPTLAEAVALARGRALLYLDKTDKVVDRVAARLEDLGALDMAVFYGRLPLPELRHRYGNLLGRIHYMPKVGDRLDDPAAYVAEFLDADDLRIPGFILDFAAEDSAVLDTVPMIRSAGRQVWMSPLWASLAAGRTDDRAVADPAGNWGWLIDRGATMLCTDRPARLGRYLERRRQEAARSSVSSAEPLPSGASVGRP